MGMFSRPETTEPTLAPLSKDRIRAALESKSWKYQVDSDGDIRGAWDSGYFWFLTTGEQQEILLIRGTWDGKLPPSELNWAMKVANDWNRDKLWPKVYARVNESGGVQIHCEHIVDYEHGLTDKQLLQHIVTVINTGCRLFDQLNETFLGITPESDS